MDGSPRSAGSDRPDPAHEPPVQGPHAETASHERTWAMFCHLAAFSALLRVPLGIIAGPLVVWLIKRKESAFVDRHGKAAVNFQLSILVYAVALVLLGRMLLGLFCGAHAGVGPDFAESLRHVGLFRHRAPLGLGFAYVCLPALAVLVVLDIVCTIVAAVRANAGRHYRYPLAIPFIR
jgi:uncharacterized Tic20 family protein